ncbi:hypothetical protein BCR37DRAFT_349740 [Protomyces lactucae-debilis]|uniref:Ribonuclease P/MRP protein subunit POP5 n=1 Tax=Protomyces lactucae-debilis TaxID=2754530 RepID=A0A1Y2F6Q2_PROLT|nr:uncharacterized protein BCR37DRAFT_349740 [Protomyces lactucae-debilis]ORY79563.1 hypothetical protein BCR37DRAFT_349740 [Protomyces lactucae-debilis]
MVRLKNRYILFEVLHPSTEVLSISQRQLVDMLRDEVALNFGKHGSGLLASSLHLKYYSSMTGRGILQADRAHYRLAWAALTYLKLPGQHRVSNEAIGPVIKVLGISGTIRKAEERLISVDQHQLFIQG